MTDSEIKLRGWTVEHWTADPVDTKSWWPDRYDLSDWSVFPQSELWVYCPRFNVIAGYGEPCHYEVANIQSVREAFPKGEGDLYITVTDGSDEWLVFRYAKLHKVEHLMRIADDYQVIDYDLACCIRDQWEEEAYDELRQRIEKMTGREIDPMVFNEVLSEKGIEPHVEGTCAFFVESPTMFDIEDMIRRSR